MHISFDPDDHGADAERPLEMSPDEELRRTIEAEVDRLAKSSA
jgi:hypothetical protein